MPALALVCLTAGAAGAQTCEVSMLLQPSVLLGALQLQLDYSNAEGGLATGNVKLDCDGDAENSIVMFGNDQALREVTVSVLSLAGFAGPMPLARCYFDDASGTTAANDFAVRVSDSTDILGNDVKAPRVTLEVDCDWDATTTTTSTTTTSTTTTSTTTTSTTSTSTSTSTTLPDDCGNGLVDGSEQCDDGDDEDGDGCDSDCTGIVCGDANGNDSVQSSDALLVLRAAIGQDIACPVSLCDADGDQILRASDSLLVLKRAVGQSVVMVCAAD